MEAERQAKAPDEHPIDTGAVITDEHRIQSCSAAAESLEPAMVKRNMHKELGAQTEAQQHASECQPGCLQTLTDRAEGAPRGEGPRLAAAGRDISFYLAK